MLITTAVETASAYVFTVSDGTDENTFVYEWGKEPPEGQTKTEYLKACKREAELLAADEIARKAPPTELDI